MFYMSSTVSSIMWQHQSPGHAHTWRGQCSWVWKRQVELLLMMMDEDDGDDYYKLLNSSFLLLQSMGGAFLAARFWRAFSLAWASDMFRPRLSPPPWAGAGAGSGAFSTWRHIHIHCVHYSASGRESHISQWHDQVHHDFTYSISVYRLYYSKLKYSRLQYTKE